MDIDFSPLQDSNFIEAYKSTKNLIDEVANQLSEFHVKVKWNSLTNVNGHFFSLSNPSNKKEIISFGIWDDLWFESKAPLFISIESETISFSNLMEFFSTFITKIQGASLSDKDEVISIILSVEYIQRIRYAREVTDLILDIARLCNFSITYNDSKW